MRRLILLLGLAGSGACGGPTHSQLAETPTAKTPARHTEAPPASTSDVDRSRLTQQFDDMQSTQQAYREAGQSNQAPPKASKALNKNQGQGKDGAAPPKKKGPAEQATLPPPTGK